MKNNKKILLISNFENTYLYHKLFFKSFESKNIYWYVVNNKNYKFLRKFYDQGKIVYLNKKNFLNFKTKDFIENDIKINELLYADRALEVSHNNSEYLKAISSYVYKFLRINKIEYIFGEFTWSYEITISRIAKLLKIPYYNIQSTRYPSNRFLFFSNERQNKFYLRDKEDKEVNFYENKNYYEDYIKNKKLENKNIFNIIKKSINLILEKYFDKYDPTYISKLKRISLFQKKKFNSLLYNFIKKKDVSELKNKYLVYFLQKQPEATTDVKGMYYSNQLENIKMIWKVLPTNFDLVIKEHPNCIGDRSINFYKKFLKLKNVYLSNGINLNKIIKGSEATFSIASTASLKSALMGVPSFTFTETFFNCLNLSFRISVEDIRNCQNFNSLLNDNLNKLKKNNDLYLRNSFPGILDLKKINEDKDNLNNIQKAISEVIA